MFARVKSKLDEFKQHERLRFIFSGGFFVLNAIALAGTAASMFFGYLFHLIMTRMLSPAEYGELSVLISVIMVLGVPGGTLQVVLTREFAKLDAQGKRGQLKLAAKHFTKLILVKIGIVSIAAILLLQLASFFFQHDYLFYLQIIVLFATFGYILPVVNAFLQGREKILELSLLNAVNPFLKAVLAALLVFAGFGFMGAFVAFQIPILLLVVPFIVYFLFKLKTPKLKLPKISFGKSFALILIASVLLMLYLYLDLFFVRSYLSAEEAGYYNVAGITSRILYFIVGGLCLVLLPKSSKLDFSKNPKEIAMLLLKSAAFLTPIFLLFMLIPTQFISFFYTEKYLPAVQPFIILSAAMFAFALFTLLLNLFWSQKKEAFPAAASLLAVIVDVILLAILTPKYGMEGAAGATLASSVLLIASSLAYLAFFLKPVKQ